ncbi:hypothetical protein D0N36_06870 [Hymenobacter lapidiphilus]|uniref:hypothetical protein n=1 Tax=Hymenobacter sp. CCM 8763 TaxID=2303334 RepID=UPI000E3479E3|nr:hypothetical protein [Hymenobacter sp. CCM 8763]RFP65920.1 hypothetical protein D0N36_06870 [Hymenobacter sp. CCM 8763]
MTYPVPIIRACAEAALPGCRVVHGEKEEANLDLDRLRYTDTVVLIEDKMLVSLNRNKFGIRTTTTFQTTVSVLAYSKLADSADVRLPRMNALLTAAMALLLKLEQHPALEKAVATSIVSAYNQFDGNLDGVVLQLNLTPAERASIC